MYCRNCGIQMDGGDRRCAQCTYVRGHGVDYCPDCGSPTKARDRRCGECSATLFVLRNSAPRNRIVAGLLAIFLGCFGVHNFYLGYMRRGLLQLIVSVIGIVFVYILNALYTAGAPLVMACWALIEAVQLLGGTVRVDADGNFLT